MDREKLLKCLNMMASKSDGECLNAARAATKIAQDAGGWAKTFTSDGPALLKVTGELQTIKIQYNRLSYEYQRLYLMYNELEQQHKKLKERGLFGRIFNS